MPAAAWDGLGDGNPFTSHRFLLALEDSGSVGPGTGWQPRHMLAHQAGKLLGAMPLYLKSHSQGEYIFDFNWADAYQRAGGSYYPKLQAAVPFTPASGARLLAHDDNTRRALLQGAVQLADKNRLSSFHLTFCTQHEFDLGGEIGLMQRRNQQFHWQNRNYGSFEDFLADLSSRKRKNIRRERRAAQAFGGEIIALSGDDIHPEHWDDFWRFYQDTGARKWGTPYLTRQFFDEAQKHLRQDMLLLLAERGGRYIAGALNFIGRDTLYGRYWGAIEHHPSLHFELCYYRAIEAAIALGLSRVEAGAQGAHKLARGYLPSPVYALHWIRDKGFAEAVQHFLQAEGEAVEEDIEELTGLGPFKREGA